MTDVPDPQPPAPEASVDALISMECERCGAHRSDVPCMTEADRLRLVARLEAAEKALKVNTPCCKGGCAPLHWCEQCVAIADARRALAGKDAA